MWIFIEARKWEKFCFETRVEKSSCRRGGTIRFYFDLKNLSLLPDKFIHLIFMGRQFKIPRISFAHITRLHPSILYLEFILKRKITLRNYMLSNICLISVRLILFYLYHCFYLISLWRQALKIMYPQIFEHFACNFLYLLYDRISVQPVKR